VELQRKRQTAEFGFQEHSEETGQYNGTGDWKFQSYLLPPFQSKMAVGNYTGEISYFLLTTTKLKAKKADGLKM